MINANLQASRIWREAGCSVIPVRTDGSKKPLGEWKDAQTSRAGHARVERWFNSSHGYGIAIVCGAVSGNLEMLELEGKATSSEHLDRIMEALINQDHVDALAFWTQLMDQGYMESTPSGGLHFLYRIEDHEVPGNTKIANRPPNADELAENPKCRSVTLAETRGEGGFVIVAPTAGTVHPTGDAWTVESGEIGVIPTVSWKTRCALHEAIANALDEMPEQPVWQPVARQHVERPAGDLKPGEDFDLREDFGALLSEYGWQYHSQGPAGSEFWTRPGKRVIDGHSASLYYQGSRNLYVWSSSTDLPLEKPISPFAFYTFMEHRGDFSAAGKALYKLGYGTRGSLGGTADDDDFWANAEQASGVQDVAGDAPVGSAGTGEQQGARKVIRVSEWTETGVAELATDLFSGRFKYVHEEKGFRYYDKGRWLKDKTSRASQQIQKLTGHLREQALEMMADAEATEDKDEIKKATKVLSSATSFRSERGIKACTSLFGKQSGVAVGAGDFEADKSLLCLDNGTYDLSTMTMREHRPDDMLTKRIPVSFDESAQAKGFEKFLEECVPNPAFREYLQVALGMTILGNIREAAFFVLHGETGCGKSQFLKIVQTVLGEYGATAARGTFTESKFSGNDSYDLHNLRGVRLASMSETKRGEVLNEDLIKRITGGDGVKTRDLFESFVEWQPEFTIWLLTNFQPKLDASDGAIWRRVKTIEFPNHFGPDRAEIGIAERLISEESAGIFNWILEGVRKYRAHGLMDPEELTKAVQEYRDSLDPVKEFLTDAEHDGTIVISEEATAPVSQIYAVYVEWSHANGDRFPMGKKRFNERMTALGYPSYAGAGNVRWRKGIARNAQHVNPIDGTSTWGRR
jgi:putative DNA primase/helicase